MSLDGELKNGVEIDVIPFIGVADGSTFWRVPVVQVKILEQEN